MSVRSVILRFLVALWRWPAVAHGQSPELIDAAMQLVQDAMAAPSRKSERVRLASKQKAA